MRKISGVWDVASTRGVYSFLPVPTPDAAPPWQLPLVALVLPASKPIKIKINTTEFPAPYRLLSLDSNYKLACLSGDTRYGVR